MILGIHHTGLCVADLDRALAFYTGFGSFSLQERFIVPDSEEGRAALGVADAGREVALLRGLTGWLELQCFQACPTAAQTAPQVHHAGIRHLCVIARDAMPAYDAMLRAGASSHAPPSGLGTGALYAYLRDPESNIVELEGAPWAAGLEHSPWYAHTAIVTPDIDRMVAFHEHLTGSHCHSSGSFGPGRRFDRVAGLDGIEFDGAWLRCGNGQVEIWRYRVPQTAPVPPRDTSALGWNHLCFESDDVDAEHSRLAAAGVEFLGAPSDGRFSRCCFGRDPDGNVFELMTPLADRPDLSVQALEGRHIPQRLQELTEGRYVSGASSPSGGE